MKVGGQLDLLFQKVKVISAPVIELISPTRTILLNSLVFVAVIGRRGKIGLATPYSRIEELSSLHCLTACTMTPFNLLPILQPVRA